MLQIPFNKPFFTGRETEYIQQVIQSKKIAGDGLFTNKCHRLLEQKYGFKKVLLTTSCTDALEMTALLLNIKAEDEVIVPSYTFVSTVNAFVLRGAKIIFADSKTDEPNLDEDKLEALITPHTKAIVVVHYAGVACKMEAIMSIANKHNLFVVEDAAQAFDGFYKDKPLGSIGHLSAFSFHETKNINCGEGGMIVVNDERFLQRAEIIREKGTNRSEFLSGKIDKYEWVDTGSSFLPSDILAAFLYAQLESITTIQERRKTIWETYYQQLKPLKEEGIIQLPAIPDYATNNGHIFYILCKDLDTRNKLTAFLKMKGISVAFHYQSLHQSPFYNSKHDGRLLPNADVYSNTLLRLPLYFELTEQEVGYITKNIHIFFKA